MLAGELIGTGILVGAAAVIDAGRAGRSMDQVQRLLSRIFPAITSCVCLVVAGSTLLAQSAGGPYWLVPAALVAIVAGLANTWVLLIEILR